MDTYYLIDFENVNSSGLVGCDTLTETDHIIIFFTENASKINMSDIANHGTSNLSMTEIPAGKQAVDIHIGSYIGYLLGKNPNGCSITIISKDTDYDALINFWEKRSGMKICRKQQIKVSEGAASDAKTVPAASESAATEKKTVLYNEIVKILRNGGYSTNDVIGFTASTAVKYMGTKDGKLPVYRDIVAKFGQEKGAKIYRLIKPKL